jgi:hypothetical protein
VPTERLAWETEVSIFRNPLIVKQLMIAIGIPFGLVVLVMTLTATSQPGVYLLYGLSLIVALFLLTTALLFAMYGGRYAVGFVVDDKGIRCYTQATHVRRNRVLNNLTVVIGFLTGKFTAAGAGMLAASRQDVTVKWNRIVSVRSYPASRTLTVSAGYLDNIAVFCTPENYEAVVAAVAERVSVK